MDDEVAIAQAIGQFAAVFARANKGLANPKRARGRCYMESTKIELSAKHRGFDDVRMLEASSSFGNHFCTAIDGIAIDITARQFDPTTPFPWIGTIEEWHWACVEWFGACEFGEAHP